MTVFVYRNGRVVKRTIYDTQKTGLPSIISDIMEPTRHMGTGRYHTSKSEFRKDTKACGCVEVGNDPQAMPKERVWVPPDRMQRREDIRRALQTLKTGGNPLWEKD
jgi:hypothetical protein